VSRRGGVAERSASNKKGTAASGFCHCDVFYRNKIESKRETTLEMEKRVTFS